MSGIHENVCRIRANVDDVLKKCGASERSVQIIAATKYSDVSQMREALSSGIQIFGENRLQDAIPKMDVLSEEKIEWHFIGRIQTNKLRKILKAFQCIQSVDREEILDDCQRILDEEDGRARVMIQLNISGESAKGGLSYSDADALLGSDLGTRYPRIDVCGLMGMGPLTEDCHKIRKCFRQFKVYFDHKSRENTHLEYLSMGMSSDYQIALEEGSNMIRLGSSIFGK